MKYFFIFGVLLSLNYHSQENLEFEKKMNDNKLIKEYNWLYKNFFLDYKLTTGSEIILLKKREVELFSGSKYLSSDDPISKVKTDKGLTNTIAGITLEPRINILNNGRRSFFIKAPVSFNLSISWNGDVSYTEVLGVFHTTSSLMFGYGEGLNSNFSNTSKKGFALSAGVHQILSPLTNQNLYNEIYTVYEDGTPYKSRRNWVMPVVQLDLYKLKGRKIRGYSISFSPSKNFFFKFAFNFVGLKK